MAFDFPNSPSEGQRFSPGAGAPTYVYKAPSWELVTVTGVTISDAAPANPLPGQTWWESDTGITYLWYDDGNSQQWVQINGTGISDAPSNTLTYGRRSAAWVPVVQATAERRNRIVNGAMQISQENGNTAGTANSYYGADQWLTIFGGTPTLTTQRVTGYTPNGSVYRYRVTVTAADASLAAGDLFVIRQVIEGARISDFRYGNALARQSILRFGFKAPAGTYSFRIMNALTDRTYVANFTISAGQANTETEQTFAIPGSTTGSWNIDTLIGFYFDICLACGTTYQAPAVGWNTGNFTGTSSNTNGMATAGAVFEIFDVGLYLDADNSGVAPRWEMPDEADELAACQRYWQKVQQYQTAFSTVTGTNYGFSYPFPVVMRTAPALALTVTGTISGGAACGVADITSVACGLYMSTTSTNTTFGVTGRSYSASARM